MKSEAVLKLALAVALTAIGAGVLRTETFENPVLAGFHADPSICRVGDDYYLVCSSFEYFPGVPIYHSRDLVNWQHIGHCLTRKSQLPLDKMRASGGIFAPTLRYHDGTFYMITTNVWGGGNFYVTAKDPAGPWSEPVMLDVEGIDPSLLFDDDGKVYYCRHVGGGDGYIGLTTLDQVTGKLEGELKNIWGGTGGVWAEGPHVYKIDGKYYLMISEGGTSYNHAVTIARSDSAWGPYEANPANPILTHRGQAERPIQAVGHADLVETPAGWWMACLGIRPQGGPFHHIGRETFLAPVGWSDDGWPVVNDNKGIEPTMAAPELPTHELEMPPARDDFDGEALPLRWNYLRNPVETNYSLSERPGYLRLKGTTVKLTDVDSPTFVGRKQRGLGCAASAMLDFEPAAESEEAGLVVRGNDENHYVVGVTMRDGKRQAFFRRVLKGKTIEPVAYANIANGAVQLSVEASPRQYDFFCRSNDGERISLGTASAQDLATEKIGGFTGAYIGMFATAADETASVSADFDWFDFEVTEK
jgi:xylan 1,4-beta-xylosidase